MNNQWQDNLRNRMERHQEPAPDGLWEGIEQAMHTVNSAHAMPAGRKIRLWGARVGVAAAAAVILFFIGLHTWKENQTNTQPAEQTTQHGQAVPTARPKQEKTPAKPEKQLFAQHTETVKFPRNVETNIPAAATDEAEKTLGKETDHQAEKEEIATPEEEESREPVNNNEQLPGFGTNSNASDYPLSRRQRRQSANWQTDLYAANIPAGAVKTHDGYGSFSPFNFPLEEEYVVAGTRAISSDDIISQSEYQHVYTDIEHLQPITFGVSMKYNFNGRWSLTSGLTYTILSSRLHSGTGNYYYNSRQTLHYVGVPLNVNYTVWENNNVSTYISGGGLLEKNVSGTLSTDIVIDNKPETQSQQEISVKQLQWSVNSALGVEYRIAKNIGIYAEPGVSYHFKNGSHVETIYKEKPLNFNIRLGLRFSLNE